MAVDFLIRASREKSTFFQKETMEPGPIKLYAIQDINILILVGLSLCFPSDRRCVDKKELNSNRKGEAPAS